MPSYIKFPQYKSYPEHLLVGFKSHEPKMVAGKKILIVLDTTGSMSESINHDKEGIKIDFAKKIIHEIIEQYPFSIVEIMPFSDNPKPIVSYKEIPIPDGCTYFTPILPEVTKHVKTNSDYTTVIFMSDGLPSESLETAQNAIIKLGSYCREAGANTIAVAIGSDADGKACSLFTGNRGYNCFGKYYKDIPLIMVDVLNGIKCNYIQISDGNWVPIEESGDYYYLSKNSEGEPQMPTFQTIRKYISLIIQDEIRNPEKINVEQLNEYIVKVAKLIPNVSEQNELIDFFTKSLQVVKKTILTLGATPSIMSAAKQAYQTFASSVSGI
jgi:hypothetical protein